MIIPGGGDDGEKRRCLPWTLYPETENVAVLLWLPKVELGE